MASQNPNPAVGGFKGCEIKLNPETFEHYEFFSVKIERAVKG